MTQLDRLSSMNATEALPIALQRINELEDRLRVVAEALYEIGMGPEILRPLSMSALRVDIRGTLERQWISDQTEEPQ